MGVKGCMKCVKYLLFVFNFVFWLAGGAVLGIALWLRFDSQTKDIFDLEGSPSTFYTGVYVLMGAGALMMLIGFLGCCGAIQESQCMPGSFFVCLLVVFAAEIAAGIWGFLSKEQIPQDMKKFYTDLYHEYHEKKTDSSKAALITFHKTLSCCGKMVITNLLDSDFKDICPTQKITDPTVDCIRQIDEIFTSKVYIIACIGIGIGVIMIFGMIFSMALCCAVRNNRDYI
uniref:Tetraspanin n=2 Tax=Petromyzontidae TaxID=7746 RepID=Q8AV92_PETMA|nr:CD9-like protein [Petromyzon marinus]ADK56110.1 CD9 antigen [Lethenteron camtschaticum]